MISLSNILSGIAGNYRACWGLWRDWPEVRTADCLTWGKNIAHTTRYIMYIYSYMQIGGSNVYDLMLRFSITLNKLNNVYSMVSMETVWSRFSNYHLQFDACMQQRVDVVKLWNRARFDFLTIKFVIWENNNNEIGLDTFIPESFIIFRTKVIRDTLTARFTVYVFFYIFAVFYHILSYFFEYVFSESGFS